MRAGIVAGAFIGLIMGSIWLFVASAFAPPRITCGPAIAADVCAETADAGLRRGMPRVHPLIIEATVVPGPAFPDAYGHRATVTYSLLPGPSVEEHLYFDAGGHWGVTGDHSAVELGAWALVPVAIAVGTGALVGGAVGTRRRA